MDSRDWLLSGADYPQLGPRDPRSPPSQRRAKVCNSVQIYSCPIIPRIPDIATESRQAASDAGQSRETESAFR